MKNKKKFIKPAVIRIHRDIVSCKVIDIDAIIASKHKQEQNDKREEDKCV